jgi:hypothetical protein
LLGYEGFWRPTSSDELKDIAQEGIIVAANVSDIRSDAILVTMLSIRALSLPHLRSTDVETWAKRGLTDVRASDTPEDRGKKNKD